MESLLELGRRFETGIAPSHSAGQSWERSTPTSPRSRVLLRSLGMAARYAVRGWGAASQPRGGAFLWTDWQLLHPLARSTNQPAAAGPVESPTRQGAGTTRPRPSPLCRRGKAHPPERRAAIGCRGQDRDGDRGQSQNGCAETSVLGWRLPERRAARVKPLPDPRSPRPPARPAGTRLRRSDRGVWHRPAPRSACSAIPGCSPCS